VDLKTFQNLPTEDVAQIVRKAGTKVVVFPIKGTRRWFLMEHPDVAPENFAKAYLEAVIPRHIELYTMIFDHGIETLLTPIFDAPLMQRGEAYMQMAAQGMKELAEHPAFLEFYETHDVRVRFYGDYRRHLRETPYEDLIEAFDTIMDQTTDHQRHRIFFGVFVEDATETIANLTIRAYQEQRRVPDKRTLVTRYYGEPIKTVDLFIGFGKLRAFDMPLIGASSVDLYFTISPSLYLTTQQLRAILYDHLYERQRSPANYSDLTLDERASMREFYQANVGKTIGVGQQHPIWHIWHPRPQVKMG
jgi:tuberculosinol/isotuberculosinol synthase